MEEKCGNSIKIAIAGPMTGDNAEYGIVPSALTSQAYSSVYAFGAHAVLLFAGMGFGIIPAVILSMLLGQPTLRLNGTYLPIVNWALGRLSRRSR